MTVVFDANIQAFEIPAFRAAVIEKAGRENTLFHNHLSGGIFLYRYPLIQYKIIDRKPSILCIDFGVDEIYKVFEKKDWSLMIGDRNVEMSIQNLNLNQFTMQVWNNKFHYRIRNWIALNQKNIRIYEETQNLGDRILFLERILTGNILSMAKGIEWSIDKPIEVKIKQIINTRSVSLKGKRMIGFNLEFSTNVFLPNHIGLGKSVSLGYGSVSQWRNERIDIQKQTAYNNSKL